MKNLVLILGFVMIGAIRSEEEGIAIEILPPRVHLIRGSDH